MKTLMKVSCGHLDNRLTLILTAAPMPVGRQLAVEGISAKQDRRTTPSIQPGLGEWIDIFNNFPSIRGIRGICDTSQENFLKA
jgi:hypothetical protein